MRYQLDESKLSEDQKAQLKVFRDTYDLPDVLNFDGKEQVRHISFTTVKL